MKVNIELVAFIVLMATNIFGVVFASLYIRTALLSSFRNLFLDKKARLILGSIWIILPVADGISFCGFLNSLNKLYAFLSAAGFFVYVGLALFAFYKKDKSSVLLDKEITPKDGTVQKKGLIFLSSSINMKMRLEHK